MSPDSEFGTPKSELPAVLTIAGSDSGGGAGIQADLKVFTALGCFGTTAITCITAQNPDSVDGVMPVDPDIVALQVRTVCSGFTIGVAKTGMLFSAEIIDATAAVLTECGIENLVVDPVMVATSGSRLLQEDAVKALCCRILPQASVITPNIPEAEVICERPIESMADMKEAAMEISERFDAACIVKGGHSVSAEFEVPDSDSPDTKSIDVLCHRGKITELSAPRIGGVDTHGSGCSFSAAITAFLAQGEEISEAAQKAKSFIAGAIARPIRVGDSDYLNLSDPE